MTWFSTNTSNSFDPAVIGGGTIGYDFVNAGFGVYNWPDWVKYFSVATDFTYNRLNVRSGGSGLGSILPAVSDIKGSAAAWTWMLMAHYGLLSDSEIPTGRVNPYVGVGPAVVWTSVDVGPLGLGSVTSTNVALVAEAGIRWVCFSRFPSTLSIVSASKSKYHYDLRGGPKAAS